LAHKIYAAADIFVVPSIFEPCGLTQLIALKYGTIPVVRRTGGLADTIVDMDTDTMSSNGFVFDNPNLAEFESACVRALKHYKNKKKWDELIVKAMSQDFSWQHPTSKYIELYRSLR
jgi:starch synthase